MTDACPHEQLQIGSEFSALPEHPECLIARIGFRCAECGQQYSFAGLPSGVANPIEPVVSADGYELRAPIYPRPGATVGLMREAGMEDDFKQRLAAAAAAWIGGSPPVEVGPAEQNAPHT
jgi:hypothetical protein